ncbi:MAG: NAD(P)-dependent oxidoreductase [Clostridia bacterium]|nr:NAD(P)-dependent oxidoreductase [Clostridia bacterium]
MKTIALTGTTGAMGGEVLLHLLQSDENFSVKCILFDEEKKLPSFVKKTFKKYRSRIQAFKGSIARYEDCVKLIDGADYVINCASKIPPKSDHDPEGTYLSNFIGTKNLVDAVKASGRQIGFVHIATVAMYGDRSYPNCWIRVGDPIISSDYDCYSLYKLKAERYLLESGLEKFVSLRQTAVLHKYMFANNLKDGLMFHTTWNGTLEWVTDRDSGRLCQNLVERDTRGELDGFWNKIYNIGGGEECRVTGYETFDQCFRLAGSKTKKIFNPNWNITRNFHGGWFYDSDELENLLGFRSETNKDFWRRMSKKYSYFKLGGVVPSPMLSKLAIQRLFKNTNSPMYWLKHGKEGRVKAFFGGREQYDKLPSKWENFPLLCEGKLKDGSEINYEEYKDIKNAKPYLLDHGYDESKPLVKLEFSDLEKAAQFRGGSCLEKNYKAGEIYKKIDWQCREGHTFSSSPYTVLKGGYWCPHCCEPKPWQYGKLADIPFYGQVYFATHDKNEISDVYPLTDNEDDFLIEK